GSELRGSCGLVGSWLGQLSNDVNLLPINYINRRLANIYTKRKSWDVIQKEYAMNALGRKCKDVKLHLWKTHKQNDLSETLQDRLKNVSENVKAEYKEQKKSLLCLTYVENIFSRRISEIVNRKKHYAKQSFSLRLARNLMAALYERMHKYEQLVLHHSFVQEENTIKISEMLNYN
ncbi:hypothetical protein HID58_024955, partial [Brassica napus]